MAAERAVVSGIRAALTAACPSLRDGEPADAVGGLVPSFVGSPASTAEASALLRAAAAVPGSAVPGSAVPGSGLAVVPRGAGTGLGWGLAPSACDLVVDLRAMDQVLEHAAGDLVVRVQAGVTMAQLAAVLAGAGQQLAVDAPADATVGGVIASGTAGPRRLRYGSPRDLLIGVTAVRADGVVAHAGGKVVKNVAGYDIGKLLAGSQGTLALITEATFRLHPVPDAVAYVTAEFDPGFGPEFGPEFGPAQRAAAVAAVQSAAGSALLPSAVELDWPPGPVGATGGRGPRVGVLVEGTSSGVAERAKQMAELLASAAGAASGAGAAGAVAVAGEPPPRWGQLPSRGTVIRVTFWVSRLDEVLEAVSAAGVSAGARPAITGSAGAGVLYACLDPGTEAETADGFVRALRDRLDVPAGAAPRGAVVMLTGPGSVLASNAYGSLPGAGLMRAIKDQFDPEHRMFPGRLGEGS
ncbi:MAG: FAD-binding oxidoreductase [Streptosporangiaceae bacterium]|jgi:glycolate oxidase FAD binding subunit